MSAIRDPNHRSPPTASMPFEPADPDYAQRIRLSFARQRIMELIGARLIAVTPGQCAIELPFRDDLTQQNGYLHAGITSTICDSAGGYAGYTLMPADSDVLTVEFKMSLLAPAAGERLIARGQVLRAGRTLVFTEGTVSALSDGTEKRIASMTQTLICVRGRNG